MPPAAGPVLPAYSFPRGVAFLVILLLLGSFAVTKQDALGDAVDNPEVPATAPFRRGDALARDGNFTAAIEEWRKACETVLPAYRGLEFRAPVAVERMDRERLRDELLGMIHEVYPDERIEGARLAGVHFGFFERDFDLKEAQIKLLTEEIAGFYDPARRRLCIIRPPDTRERRSGLSRVLDRLFDVFGSFRIEEIRTVVVHELTHALADQHFELDRLLLSVLHDDDMALACSAVVEGEATLMMVVAQAVTDADRDDLHALLRAPEFAAPMARAMEATATMMDAPPLMARSLVFPYAAGLEFCATLGRRTGDWSGINRAFREPPLSSEQIIHPEKFRGDAPDAPSAIRFTRTAPLAARGWTLAFANVLGEFGIQILLRDALGEDAGDAAAAGWDGDRYEVWRRNSDATAAADTVLAWATTWDSEDDASEFARGLSAQRAGSPAAELMAEETRRQAGRRAVERIWIAGDRVSGIWRSGADVWLLERAPPDLLAELADWLVAIEIGPKAPERVRRF